MPNYVIHGSIGIGIGVVSVYFLDMPLYIILLSLIYSIFADIDTPSSIMRRMVTIVAGITVIGATYMQQYDIAIVLIVLLVMLLFLKHRGFTHTVRCALFCSIPWIYISPLYACVAFLSYLSHLVLDVHIKW